MYFCNLENRESKELASGVHARTFWGERMLLANVKIDAYSEVPSHSHPHEQCGAVIEGELLLSINGEERTLKPGECYVIPGGTEHSARTSTSHALLVEVFSPVREEFKF